MARTAAILHGPIVPTLLRLGLPTLLVLIVQTMVGVIEAYFVGFLGTDALAGVALVFPVLMLMQMMSNGGIGGGVAAASARALGAGKREEAEALAWHALVLAVVFGVAFTALTWIAGPALYAAMGGTDGALGAALVYSNVLFAGAVPLWIVSLLAAALRGTGNVQMPAKVTFASALVLIPLSPLLIFGWGPMPRLGVVGAGLAVAIYYVGAAIWLIAYMRSSRSTLRLARVPLAWPMFRRILGVGGLSAISTIQSNLTVALVTAGVGLFAADAIAGYGIASRIDYLLIPLLFGFGTAVVTMVGANIGAGNVLRARRIAWTAGLMAGAATGLIGLAAAVFGRQWAGLFSDDPAVIETAALYLRHVAPFYGLFGLGMMLYFAGQGANRVLIPVLAGTMRLLVAGLLGWLAVRHGLVELPGLFGIVAVSMALFGIICAAALLARRDSWTSAAAPVSTGPTPAAARATG
jgi:putative MATE family efflux protein